MTTPKLPSPDQIRRQPLTESELQRRLRLIQEHPELLRQLAPSKRRALEEGLAEHAALKKANPIAFWHPYESARTPGYSPQLNYLKSRAWIKAFFGGNGSGKTDIGTVDDIIQLVDGDVLPPRLRQFKRWQPPFYLRIVVPKADQIQSMALEKFRQYMPRDQLLGGSFEKAYAKASQRLILKNGSWVVFNTGEQDRDAHSGIELHRVRFDEEPPEPIYTENIMRLRRFAPEAQVCFTMTPLLGLSWTFDTIFERRDDPEAGIDVFRASMLDNPYIDHQAMLRAIGHLSDAERAAVIEGQFVSFHGRVLHQFDPETHVVDPPSREHVQSLDTYVGIDPGISRGGVVWVGFDRENAALVYDELYPSGETVPSIARKIHERNAYWGVKDPIYVIDPSAQNRSLVDAERVEAAWQRERIWPIHGQHDRTAGFLELRRRVEASSLLASRECVNWLKEADRLVLAEDEISREQAKKTNAKGTGAFATVGPDHLIDPTRYVCMERPWWQNPHQAPRERWTLATGRAPSLAELRGLNQPAVGPLGKYS